MYQTIVSTQTLATQINDPDWVIFDCRFELSKPQEGKRLYEKEHICLARYASLDDDLSSKPTASSGRHPLPHPEEISHKLKRWGVSQSSQVVIYDQSTGSLAARMWWLLRWLGHSAVAVLDGGLNKWISEGLPTDNVIPEPVEGDFKGSPDDSMWVPTDYVESLCDDPSAAIIDARSRERFSGEQEPVDSIGGHIQGAINHPLTDNLDEQGCFLSPGQLRSQLEPLQKTQTIHSCGSGVTACHNILAMEIAGLSGSKLYVGSWSEWICSPQRPIVAGGN